MTAAAQQVAGPANAQQQLKSGTDHSVAASAYAYPASQVQGWLRHTQPQPATKLAFLTFDDGPSGVTTPQVLDILRAENVHATFFLITRQIGDFDAGLVRAEIAAGHGVAIHSYSHDYHYLYPQRFANATHVACDLAWSQAVMTAVLGPGYHSQAMRYPGGHMSWRNMAPADAALASRGVTWIDWDALSGDADMTLPRRNVQDLIDNAANTEARNKPGSVIVLLCHDFYPNRLEVGALRAQIEHLKALGYSFGIID